MHIIAPYNDRVRQYLGHFYGNETGLLSISAIVLIAVDTLSNTVESGKTNNIFH